jgi:hypothetical protein
MPPGQLVETIDCSLNEGTSMAEAIDWARNAPRTGGQPNLQFYREAIYNNPYRENYDFRIASYYQSYSERVASYATNQALPANRVRPGVRRQDLFTCDNATLRVSLNRTVNQENDGFTGDITLMTSRFCMLNEGATVADAYTFAQEVAENYRDAGDNSLMQLYTRSLSPVANRTGTAVVITAVPSTPENMGTRLDLPRGGFNALAGVDSPLTCNYPAMWITNAVYRAQPPAQ